MSLDTNSISYNANNLNDNGVIVVSRPTPMLSKPRLWIEQLSGADGAAVQGGTFDPRMFRFACMLYAGSETARDTYLENLVDIFEVCQEGEKALILGWKPTVYYNVRLMSAFDPDCFINGARFDLDFIAPNPVAVAI